MRSEQLPQGPCRPQAQCAALSFISNLRSALASAPSSTIGSEKRVPTFDCLVNLSASALFPWAGSRPVPLNGATRPGSSLRSLAFLVELLQVLPMVAEYNPRAD